MAPDTSINNPRKQKHGKCIRDVWASTLMEEMPRISQIVEKYRYISVDTEFPGVVVTPLCNSESPSLQWKTICCNVNILKIIQLGLTFSDQNGNHPLGVCTWQFNFHFDIGYDMYAQDSLELLENAGIDFERHLVDGIDVSIFAELLISSGLVLNDENKWIAFHSGYDFGYLMKVLTSADLPDDEAVFFEELKTWFGQIYDLKYLIKNYPYLNHRCGLNQLAQDLKVQRIGPMHQAGSDSLLTSSLFFKIRQSYAVEPYANILYGLGEDADENHKSLKRDSFDKQALHKNVDFSCSSSKECLSTCIAGNGNVVPPAMIIL